MHDVDVSPFGMQVFGDEAPVAMLRRRLTAEQDGRYPEEVATDGLLDLALNHQGSEPLLVVCPAALTLLEVVQKLLRGREQWLVQILRLADLAEKVCQVVLFREPCELR